MTREKPKNLWLSRWGFILAATGSAVGLGNIWKFPYVAGVSGGVRADPAALVAPEAIQLDEDKINDCLKLMANSGETLDKVVLKRGYLSEPEVMKILAGYLGYQFQGSIVSGFLFVSSGRHVQLRVHSTVTAANFALLL